MCSSDLSSAEWLAKRDAKKDAQLAQMRDALVRRGSHFSNCPKFANEKAVCECPMKVLDDTPSTAEWMKGQLRAARHEALKNAADKMESTLYNSENHVVHADWLRDLAATQAGENPAIPESGAPANK